MILQDRIDWLSRLGVYMVSDDAAWKQAKQKSSGENSWFIPEFIELAVKNIAEKFLKKDNLEKWAAAYNVPASIPHPKSVGIVMAGNIPLVGFHDLLAVFISGHKAIIKLSSKDKI